MRMKAPALCDINGAGHAKRHGFRDTGAGTGFFHHINGKRFEGIPSGKMDLFLKKMKAHCLPCGENLPHLEECWQNATVEKR
ncbi:hypothetical protein [Desulfobaculum bizertense]|uniref:hypothetical protein n=1 Tax=Desulfobaculum bizertense TaxID=376490 RepID=UPI00117FD41F|nr:hypothetical protein [Desulfobaculum bizertense]